MVVYPAELASLAKITDQVQKAAKQAGLSERAQYDVEVAIDEACANIIEHSYAGEAGGEIECTCQILPEGLKIVLHDTGCFFDPNEVPEPDIHSPLDQRKEGGLGLYFMRKLMDEVIFDPCQGQGTLLTMIKRKE